MNTDRSMTISIDQNGEQPRRREVTHHCVYRVVWCAKFTRPLLVGIEAELRGLLDAAALEFDAEVESAEISATAVSVLLRVDPTVGVHRVVRHLKGRSSNALRGKYPSLRSRVPTLWNSRYLVSTLGAEPGAVELDAFVRRQAHS